MIQIDSALALFNKYGYSSITTHPYIYQFGDSVGICYTYDDEEFGTLERIKVCKQLDEMKDFLEKQKWLEDNGKNRHVRMILDNYESYNPKVLYLRNNKLMVQGEMVDVEAYDRKEDLRKSMDMASQFICEAGDLLLIYNEIKSRQLLYLKSLVELKNLTRSKYYELQKEVDVYNKTKTKRELSFVSEFTESGINEPLEIAVKDKYNKYVVQIPSLEEAQVFLKEVWDLLHTLELNDKYYEAIIEDSEIRNELKIVDQKIAVMKELNGLDKTLFCADLISRFQQINQSAKENSVTVSRETVNMQLESVKRKYSYFNKLDPLYASDYLREAVQNTNYENLVLRYAPGASVEVKNSMNTPLNEIAASLTVQYREKLSEEEQSVLILYNNEKYRRICDGILAIPDFINIPIKDLIKTLSSLKGFSKLKTECYDNVRKRIDAPENVSIKTSLFSTFDFSTFETFLSSLVGRLELLNRANEKLKISGDINMYLSVNNVNDINSEQFIRVTSDLEELENNAYINKSMIGITFLEAGLPVLYSPYYFDMGDTFSRDASPAMYIKEMVHLSLLIDMDDVNVSIDPKMTRVVNYQSIREMEGNIALVKDLVLKNIIMFCKYALSTKNSVGDTSTDN